MNIVSNNTKTKFDFHVKQLKVLVNETFDEVIYLFLHNFSEL